MRDFLVLSLLCSLVGTLLPASFENGMGKSVALLAALSILLAVSVPVVELASEISDGSFKIMDLLLPDDETICSLEETAQEWVVQYSVDNIEADIETLVENRFSLQTDTVHAQAVTETTADGTLIIRYVHLSAETFGVCDTSDISAFVGNLLATPCEVTVHFEKTQSAREE